MRSLVLLAFVLVSCGSAESFEPPTCSPIPVIDFARTSSSAGDPEPTTPSEVDMAQRTLWGRQVTWPANRPTGQKETLVNAAIDTTCTPIVWGIQISADWLLFDPVYVSKINVYARIEWGSLGGYQSVDVDVLNGVTLNLVGHSVKVTIIDESTYGATPITSPFSVSASASPGTLSKTHTTTRTLTYIVGVDSNDLLIPNFAKTVSIMRYNAASPLSNYVFWFTDQFGLLPISSTSIPATAELQDFAIPGNATDLVFSSTGIGNERFTVVFGLDL